MKRTCACPFTSGAFAREGGEGVERGGAGRGRALAGVQSGAGAAAAAPPAPRPAARAARRLADRPARSPSRAGRGRGPLTSPPRASRAGRRGPGLKEGASSAALGSHVDLAATFVSLAGGAPPALSDGQPVPLQPVAKPGFSFFVPKHAYEL